SAHRSFMAAKLTNASALPPEAAVGIAGAGTMGGGIAQVAAMAGHTVHLYDARAGAAQAAKERIAHSMQRLAGKGDLPTSAVSVVIERVNAAESLEELRSCGLIVEAINEELDAKRALFRDISKIVTTKTLLATNTSSL